MKSGNEVHWVPAMAMINVERILPPEHAKAWIRYLWHNASDIWRRLWEDQSPDHCHDKDKAFKLYKDETQARMERSNATTPRGTGAEGSDTGRTPVQYPKVRGRHGSPRCQL